MRRSLLGNPKPNVDQQRDRHGFRGTPPPACFSLAELPDDTQLTEAEVAAAGRWSISTVASWRRQPDHPLKWTRVADKFVRYCAGDLKRYMATGLAKSKPSVPPRRSTRSDRPPRWVTEAQGVSQSRKPAGQG